MFTYYRKSSRACKKITKLKKFMYSKESPQIQKKFIDCEKSSSNLKKVHRFWKNVHWFEKKSSSILKRSPSNLKKVHWFWKKSSPFRKYPKLDIVARVLSQMLWLILVWGSIYVNRRCGDYIYWISNTCSRIWKILCSLARPTSFFKLRHCHQGLNPGLDAGARIFLYLF